MAEKVKAIQDALVRETSLSFEVLSWFADLLFLVSSKPLKHTGPTVQASEAHGAMEVDRATRDGAAVVLPTTCSF